MATDRELLAVLSDNLGCFRARDRQTRDLREIAVTQMSELLLTHAHQGSAERYSEFCRFLPDATGAEKLRFCQALCQKAQTAMPPASDTKSHIRISYVRNPGNEDALRHFQSALPPMELHHVTGFSQACEEVLDGKSNACLLPLLSSGDGRLLGFYELLERHDLQVLLSCDIETEEGARTIRYALAGRCVLPLRGKEKRDFLLEFSITDSGGLSIDELFCAAKACSAELLALDTVPLPYGEGLNRYYFTFRILPASAQAFCLYLSLQYTGYDQIGLYPTLPRTSV